MSAIAWTINTLTDEWEPLVSGRSVRVPQPVVQESQQDSQASIQERDQVVVRDGGTTPFEPGTLGHNENTTETFVQIDVRTTDRNRPQIDSATRSPGYVRLFGKRAQRSNTGERYGGLIGEITRLLQTHRRGADGFTRIQIEEVNDISSQSGMNHYRATLTVRFDQILQNVDPEK